MNILYYIFFLTSIHKVQLYLIQNQNKPICANCKFGNVDIITGKHSYESATIVRNDENKCGEYAIFYKNNYFKFITVPYYFLLEHGAIIFSASILWYSLFRIL